jgi:hypothetical protein
MDPDEIDGYEVEGYHEHECIIDPSTITRITYERVESSKRSGSPTRANG